MVHNNPASSSAATNVIQNLQILPFILKYRCQFVAALEDAELLCTIVSDTGTDKIILSQAPPQKQLWNL
jgi:hypothetical protein